MQNDWGGEGAAAVLEDCGGTLLTELREGVLGTEGLLVLRVKCRDSAMTKS